MTGTYGTCLDLIERGACQNASRIAIQFEDQSLTFAQANAAANRMSHALGELGCVPGTRIALLLNNGLLSVPLDFACVKAGVNRVPLNSRLSIAEHARMIEEAQCDLLVFGPDLVERAVELQQAIPTLRLCGLGVMAGVDPIDLLTLAENQPDTPPAVAVHGDDIIVTLYTSGTTGVLKAAQHTQASYAAICRNILLNLFPAQPDDAMLHAASLIHASGTFVLPLWLRGGRTIILSGFDPASFLDQIDHYGATAINLVPTMIQMVLETPGIEARTLPTLQRIIYGASPMPRVVIDRAIGIFGQQRFWQYYGQTKSPLCIAVLRPEDHEGDQLSACGRPALDCEIRLVDADGKDVGPGEPGEIIVRGPITISGYFNAPELNAATFGQDGWIYTRDVGKFDDRGFLHLLDRTSDMIISGGYNIYPREVEDALLAHADVLECAVIGTPDEKWVEAVTAFVVLRREGAVDADELIRFVSERLASYKKPHSIRFVDAIPKTAVGKLDRRKLRSQALA